MADIQISHRVILKENIVTYMIDFLLLFVEMSFLELTTPSSLYVFFSFP